MDGVIVVGTGYWGMKYVKILNEMGILRGVVEVDDGTREKVFHSVSNDVRCYEFYEQILMNNKEFEGVIICTPPSSHVEIAKYFLMQDKYVLIEKPIGINYNEVLELYPYRERCMPGLIYLYNPYIIRMKNYISVNDVNHIYFRRTSHGSIRSWQNAMWDLAPHDISISNYFMESEPIGAKSFYDKDWAMIDLEYIGGIHSLIYVSWLGYPKTRDVEVILNNQTDYQYRNILHELECEYMSGDTPLERMLNKFLSKDWKYGYEEGLSTVKILEELSRSV